MKKKIQWLFSNHNVYQIENRAAKQGYTLQQPKWYRAVQITLLVLLQLSIFVMVGLMIKYFGNLEGSELLLEIIIAPIFSLLFLILYVISYISSRKRFLESLPAQLKSEYVYAIKQRVKKLVILYFILITATLLLSLLVLWLNRDNPYNVFNQ